MADDKQIIDAYAAGAPKLREAIANLSREQLLARPIAGKWSTQEVTIHLADAETAFADRVRRMVAQDNPTLMDWDENRFAASLFYEEQSAEDAATLVELTRRQLVRILRQLPPDALGRAGVHSTAGRQTIADVLSKASWHLDHHLKFVREKRAALGVASPA